MSQRATSIYIPQPCAESWAAMTPTGLGRHCAACQKTVIDFTQKSDAEILAYLANAAGETCGRLGSDQLNRPLLPALGARPPGRPLAGLASAGTGGVGPAGQPGRRECPRHWLAHGGPPTQKSWPWAPSAPGST